ncbi:nitric oxide-associated protein 1 [Eublepharis macularius]|uniref:Nitric oxide-associated protein 1 n=1 Tax=Eublepharis macularius TaxID=481883 RepID=A0AA97L5K7_EUBMA|nr:nitric oxide-associated protein 1 [Eublepharis macularius]XP_054843154.1 nitric oxide-associated protein 1 [Eublepharis macularius]
MQGLRRAWAAGLPGVWRRWAAGAAGGAGAAPRRAALGGSSPFLAAAEEEAFVFPEFLPEGPAAEGPPPPRGHVQEAEAAPPRRPAPAPRRRKAHEAAGRPDPSVPPSGVSCSGCGAELHCRDPASPGYLPSAKYLSLVGGPAGEARAALEEAVCQRCWFLVHHQQALQVQVTPEEYRRVVSTALRGPPRHGRPPLVLCMVDVLELPDVLLLPELVGSQAHVLVLGNKVDLLPGDSPRYLKRLREHLLEACARVGLDQSSGGPGQREVDVHLISAKTGYGVEELISKLQRSWKFNGDVYLVGATNTGKSTLFNTLLCSDYCKSRASDVTSRATISPWPGTTLNLLKFPIINPTPFRIFRREERLATDAAKTEEDLNEDERKHLKTLKKQGYLIGRVGRTFQLPQKLKKNREVEFDAETLSFSTEEEPAFPSETTTKKGELSYNEVKDARWFYDTPGIIKDGCVLNFLKEKEVKLVLPTCAIVPRTFLLKPGDTLFLGALGRIDYLQGDQSSWFSVVASNLLPVHITMVEKADALYQKHAGHILLKVPIGGEERMKDFPPLVPQDVMLEGVGAEEAVADIKLSSAGWVAVTAHSNNKMHLRCYTPEGTVLTIRKPPLLPHIVQVKGDRVKRSPAYKTQRPPSLVENLRTNVKK